VSLGRLSIGKHYKLWLTDWVTTSGRAYSLDSILYLLLFFALKILRFRGVLWKSRSTLAKARVFSGKSSGGMAVHR
jgi:hypothetical protein